MLIGLEAQHAVGHPEPRGVGHYSINLIKALLQRGSFEYVITFFDYNKEAKNRSRAEKLFSNYNAKLCECNELDYRIASRDDSVFSRKSYCEYTKTNCSIYHFLNTVSIPSRIEQNVIVTVHDMNWKTNPEGFSDRVLKLVKTGLERLNALQPEVIAISNYTRDELLMYSDIPSEKIHVIYQSYDEPNLFPDSSKPNSIVVGDYILFVGTIENKKNVLRIVNAFQIVAEKYKELQLVIVGKPTWEDPAPLYAAIENSGLSKRIILTGYVDIETKRKLYSHALCFLFPSICEGWGNPILEAMACGCPVITSDITAMPEAGGDAAVYTDPYNTEMLADKISAILSSTEYRNELIAKGLSHSRLFSWDKTASEVEAVYRKVLGQ